MDIVLLLLLLLLHVVAGRTGTYLSPSATLSPKTSTADSPSPSPSPASIAVLALSDAVVNTSSTLLHEEDPIAVQCGSVKIYRPRVFSLLRRHADISEEAFLSALTPIKLSTISADSKSGQTFWRSADGRIVLKTIKAYECRTMRRVLDSYALHVLTGRSAIASVLGIYRVVGKSGHKTYFLATANVYPNAPRPMKKFDLKGSFVGRRALPTSDVLKDLDLLTTKYRLAFDGAREMVLRTLARDTEFLRRNGLMDYSLLVAVEKQAIENGASSTAGCLRVYGEDGYLVHLGIIDFLQSYTLRKFFETELKSIISGGEKISCVDPGSYAKRFVEFIKNVSV